MPSRSMVALDLPIFLKRYSLNLPNWWYFICEQIYLFSPDSQPSVCPQGNINWRILDGHENSDGQTMVILEKALSASKHQKVQHQWWSVLRSRLWMLLFCIVSKTQSHTLA